MLKIPALFLIKLTFDNIKKTRLLITISFFLKVAESQSHNDSLS